VTVGPIPDVPASDAQTRNHSRWAAWSRAHAVGLWACLLTFLILAPVLAPGYVLSYDMNFVPKQIPLPWMAGLGGGLPRAVPQDLVVALLSGPLPGQLLQKLALFGALIGAGMGVGRILRRHSLFAALLGATLAIWNPFVVERLVLGHWSLLISYAAVPWLLAAVQAVRQGSHDSALRLVVIVAIGSLVPSGGVVMAVLALPALMWGSALGMSRRIALGGAIALINLTWVLPALLNANSVVSDPRGVAVFALHSESWGGLLVTALGGGGAWNGEVVPSSRSLPWIPVVAIVFAALAVVGFRQLCAWLGRAATWALAGTAGVGLAAGVLGAWSVTQQSVTRIITDIPGGGILRDGQKLLIPLVVLIALAAPLGLERVIRKFRAPSAARQLALAMVLALPILAMPDAVWGVAGRLSPVSYPVGWSEVRATMAAGAPGDAVSLPWAQFRRYPWNAKRTVLDPAPRFMTRTVITDDSLLVNANGTLVKVGGDDPRSAQVGAALESGAPLSSQLPSLGVRWVIEQTDQPTVTDPKDLVGMKLAVQTPGLRLWEAPGEVVEQEAMAFGFFVYLIDVIAALLVLAAGASLATRVRKHRHSGAHE